MNAGKLRKNRWTTSHGDGHDGEVDVLHRVPLQRDDWTGETITCNLVT